ncbi:hypothetical protein JP0395_07160 [Helicobacter pylori]
MGSKATLKKKGARSDNPNAYEEKRLYLNLKHQPNMDNPEDNYQFEFHSSDIREKMNELVDALKDKGFPNVGMLGKTRC